MIDPAGFSAQFNRHDEKSRPDWGGWLRLKPCLNLGGVGEGVDFGAAGGLADEHGAHDFEVVVDRHRHVERRHHRQHVVPRLKQRKEDVILPQEPRP